MTTKKRISRVFAVALAIVLMMALAVPAFAAPPPANQRVWIFNTANASPNLNAATKGIPQNYTNVTMWEDTNSDTQRWDLKPIDITRKLYNIRNYSNTLVGLNIYRDGTNNCNLFSIASNSYDDKTIKCVEEGPGYHYGIVVPAYALCLTPTGFENGSNVEWQTPSGASTQLWWIAVNR